MKFLKRFNILDYCIIFAAAIAVFIAAMNVFSQEELEKITICAICDAEIAAKRGDLCKDLDAQEDLGRLAAQNGLKITILSEGKREAQGAEIGKKTYLINMPLRLAVGDFYVEAKIRSIKYGG